MAITRAKKESLLKEVTESLSNAVSVIFVAFKGMNVKEANELRDALRTNGVKYTVVKKTLLKKALTEKGYEGEMPEMPGEVAMAYISSSSEDTDVTLPARSLGSFVKKFKGKLGFLGGALEGRYLSLKDAVQVAEIPATPVLRGMFVNIINSPIQRMVIALNQIAEKKA